MASRARRSILRLPANTATASVLVVWMFIAGGCSGFKGPEVKVAGFVVNNATDEGLELEIYLDLININDSGLELRLYEYTIWADGVRAYQGVWSAEQTLPAASERSGMVPAVLLDRELGWKSQDRPKQVKLRVMGTILYIAPGQLAETLLEWGLYQPREPFGAEETVELIPEHQTPEKSEAASNAS